MGVLMRPKPWRDPPPRDPNKGAQLCMPPYFQSAKPDAVHDATDVHRALGPSRRSNNGAHYTRQFEGRRYAPDFSNTEASRPSKVEPGSDHGSSQS